MNSHDANRIARKHKDPSTISWIGSSEFEKVQMFKVDGHPEIILELAANLEIDNVEYVGEMTHIPSTDIIEDDEIMISTPELDGIKIHIYINDKFKFSTNEYLSKKEALLDLRSKEIYQSSKLRAVLSNPGSDKRALESLNG